jgi:predicted N-formylglutamate amidohydrolase
MNETQDGLLAADESPAFTVDNENGRSPFLIVADHAGKHFPRRLGQLGLSNAECEGHIAWDIGAGAVCCLIGKALDAVVFGRTIPGWLSTATEPRGRRRQSST